jgi:uncharacterized protein YbjT (DUF2867 family)
MKRVLLAGATGAVGYEFLHQAKQAGCWIRTLSRDPARGAKVRKVADECGFADAAATDLAAYCAGVDVVVSCLGASVSPRAAERRSYIDVDTVANLALLDAARRAGVRRFLYVAAHVEDGYRETSYIAAHEAVVARLGESGLSHTVVRPTGIFAAFHDFLRMARWGCGLVVGSGHARTNPIHQREVARALLENLESGPESLSIGGPEVMSRRAIVEAAFEALEKTPRIFSLPAGVSRFGARVLGGFRPRLGDLLEFVAAVSESECVAPCYGVRNLRGYFAALAAGAESARGAPAIRQL